ncbi:hypothetical protein ACWAT4_24095 [Bradyrhizobium manausense]
MTARRTLTYNGLTLSHDEWAERYSINKRNLRWRLDAGWPAEQALTAQRSKRGQRCSVTRTPTLAEQLPALRDWQRDMHAAHRQMTRSVRSFVRQMEEQMAELRYGLDQHLAAQLAEAERNILASHTPGEASTDKNRAPDRSIPAVQETL